VLIAELGDENCKLPPLGIGPFIWLGSSVLVKLVFITEKSVLTERLVSVDKRDRRKRGRNQRGTHKKTKEEEICCRYNLRQREREREWKKEEKRNIILIIIIIITPWI
jgi:hypothetical protein